VVELSVCNPSFQTRGQVIWLLMAPCRLFKCSESLQLRSFSHIFGTTREQMLSWTWLECGSPFAAVLP
jgi:hypothetical protein